MNCKVVWPSRGAGVRDSWDSCKRFHGGAAELQAEVVDDGDGDDGDSDDDGHGEDCDGGDGDDGDYGDGDDDVRVWYMCEDSSLAHYQFL